MSKTKVAAVKMHKSLARGLIAGLIGGLAATAAKAIAERISAADPWRAGAAESPSNSWPETLSPAAKARLSEGLRWGLGAAAGAAYGAVAEFYPRPARHGASFGLAMEALAHQGELPVQHARLSDAGRS